VRGEDARGKIHGWRIVGAAFVLAFFGWGLGFYGPPVYLHAVREARGFSLGVVSAAVTVHFLAGALVAANVPALYRRFGVARRRPSRHSCSRRHLGWAIARDAVAALRRDAGQRRRLGRDEAALR
jgi:hypothetical protein